MKMSRRQFEKGLKLKKDLYEVDEWISDAARAVHSTWAGMLGFGDRSLPFAQCERQVPKHLSIFHAVLLIYSALLLATYSRLP